MPRDNTPINEVIPLLEIGPFGGLDPTTEPYYVSSRNFVDGLNFVPNNGYGGFVTPKGRLPFLAQPLPGQCTGMFRSSRPGLPDIFFFAVTVANQGQIYYSVAGGVAVQLALPEILTPNLQTSFASSLQWVFLTNGVDVPLKIHVSDLVVTFWGIVAPTIPPTVAASGSSSMLGVYTYSVTFGNSLQESSQGYPVSASVAVIGQGIQLTNIPVSTDPQVTQRNIYRIGGALGQWRLVATINNNTSTSLLDTLPDALVGQLLTVFRDPPLPFQAICNHMERIWGFGTPNDASVVYWSNINEPWGFNNLTSNLPVGENSFNDAAVGLDSIGGTLVLSKNKTTYGVYGNTDDTFVVNKLFDIGCKSLRSITVAYGMYWWVSRQGIYMYDGGNPNNLSDGNYQQSNIKSIMDGLTDDDLAQSTSFVYQRMFHVCFPTINRTYVYDLRSQNWYPMGWALDQVSFDMESQLFPVVGTNLLLQHQVDTWFATGGDLGGTIDAFITSKISDSDDITSTKAYRYVEVEAPGQKAVMTFQVTVNPGGGTYQDTQVIDLSLPGPRHQLSLPGTVVGTQVQLNMRVRSANVIHVQKFGVYGWVQRTYSEND